MFGSTNCWRAVLFWNRATKGNGAPCDHPRWGESTFGGSQSQRTKYFGRKVRWWMTLFSMLLSWRMPNVFKSCNSQPSPFRILYAVLIELFCFFFHLFFLMFFLHIWHTYMFQIIKFYLPDPVWKRLITACATPGQQELLPSKGFRPSLLWRMVLIQPDWRVCLLKHEQPV